MRKTVVKKLKKAFPLLPKAEFRKLKSAFTQMPHPLKSKFLSSL